MQQSMTTSPKKPLPARRLKGIPSERRSVNLALQGGGSHGAFTWGVLDKLLEDGRLDIEGISGTSAGSMNAVALAYGSIRGHDGARAALHDFWQAISKASERSNPFRQIPWPLNAFGWMGEQLCTEQFFRTLANSFSPYQFNPLNLNPLREVLVQQIDFERLHRQSKIKLFLTATNVRSGKGKVFGIEEKIAPEMVLASACLPQLFQAVEVNGEHYWDGGYMGNPVLYPLFYHTQSSDVIVVHVNPIAREALPMSARDIFNRVNEISFNSSLIKEFRAICFVQKLMEEGWIKDEFMGKLKYVLMHSIRADQALLDLPVNSKFNSDWSFLIQLRDRGRACAATWLEQHFDALGLRSSVDLKHEFL